MLVVPERWQSRLPVNIQTMAQQRSSFRYTSPTRAEPLLTTVKRTEPTGAAAATVRDAVVRQGSSTLTASVHVDTRTHDTASPTLHLLDIVQLTQLRQPT